MFSGEALRRLRIDPDGLHPDSETYDLGIVETGSVNLDARYHSFWKPGGCSFPARKRT